MLQIECDEYFEIRKEAIKKSHDRFKKKLNLQVIPFSTNLVCWSALAKVLT